MKFKKLSPSLNFTSTYYCKHLINLK